MSLTSTDPEESVIAMLENGSWTNQVPTIQKLSASEAKSRFNNPDPVIHVNESLGDLDRFSADGDTTEDNRTIDILVSTMEDTLTHEYTEDVINIIGEYVDDNTNLTVFEDVDPTAINSFRGGHIGRRTNAYISSVEVETARLRPTG